MNDNLYINELTGVALDDVAALERAQKNYGNSWKKRGGIGAFMMLARKWDRLEKFLSEPPIVLAPTPDEPARPAFPTYDVLGAIMLDRRAEGIIDDIRDLRRYLMLVEAEARAQNYCPGKLAKDLENGTASKGGTHTSLAGKDDPHHPLCDCPVCIKTAEHNAAKAAEAQVAAPAKPPTPEEALKAACAELEAMDGDADRLRAIMDKYRISHPHFAKGAKASEILVDVLAAINGDDTPPASVLHPD